MCAIVVSAHVQEESSSREIIALKGQLRSSEATVADSQNTLKEKDSELEILRPKVCIIIISHVILFINDATHNRNKKMFAMFCTFINAPNVQRNEFLFAGD